MPSSEIIDGHSRPNYDFDAAGLRFVGYQRGKMNGCNCALSPFSVQPSMRLEPTHSGIGETVSFPGSS